MTCGNLGPEGGQSMLPGIMTLAISCVAVFIWPFFTRRQKLYEQQLEQKRLHAKDFAVFVDGLPPDAVSENEISDFFSKHAIPGLAPVKIVKTVIAYDVHQYTDLVEKKLSIEKSLRKLKNHGTIDTVTNGCYKFLSKLFCRGQRKSPQEAEEHLSNQLHNISEQLENIENMQMRGAGCAVVTFKSREDALACINCWSCGMRQTLLRWSMGMIESHLPKFRGQHSLMVSPAPSPTDIQWKNLGVPRWNRFRALLCINGLLAGVLLLSLSLVIGLVTLNLRLRNKHYDQRGATFIPGIEGLIGQIDVTTVRNELSSGEFRLWYILISLLPSLAISIVNNILWALAVYFSRFERSQTISEADCSIMVKLTCLLTVNTSMVYLIVFYNSQDWYISGGLMENAFIQLVFNFFWEPLCGFLALGTRVNRIRGRCTNLGQSNLTQQELNTFFEGPDFESPGRFAMVMKSFTVMLIFLPVFPLGSVLYLATVMCHYWADKYILLRISKRPYCQSALLATTARRCLRVLLLLLPGLSMYLLSPSMASSVRPFIFSYGSIGLIVVAVSLALPDFLQVKLADTMIDIFTCGGRFRMAQSIVLSAGSKEKPSPSYYEAQWRFLHFFHRTNPLYAVLPEDVNPELIVDPEDEEAALFVAQEIVTGVTADKQFRVGDLRTALSGFSPEMTSRSRAAVKEAFGSASNFSANKFRQAANMVEHIKLDLCRDQAGAFAGVVANGLSGVRRLPDAAGSKVISAAFSTPHALRRQLAGVKSISPPPTAAPTPLVPRSEDGNCSNDQLCKDGVETPLADSDTASMNDQAAEGFEGEVIRRPTP
eukprot:GHVT01032208.1.p1 GENE.GHVT01032208.1~~GHVT01032208.1.p1  ORF type:complete len:824 (-),score=75.00 GHVT01032208.1:725-3196(-)